MIKLYWKIFLGFWLTSVLLVGVILTVNQQLQRSISHEISGLSPSEIVNRTEFIIRRIPSDLDDWQVRLSENDINLYLQHQTDNSLSEARPPPTVSTIFEMLHDQDTVEKTSFIRSKFGGRIPIIANQYTRYVLDMPSLTIFRLRKFAAELIAQLTLSISLSAFACYILAKYLTRNLKKISVASRSLAQGNLNARIELGKTTFADEFTVLSRDFNHMASQLETSMNNQKRLVRDISHELRSPLARIQIAVELARQSDRNSELDRIERESMRLNEMIGQLLTLPTENLPLDATIELGGLVQSIIEENEIEAQAKSISISFSIKTDEALVLANTEKLCSAIENILRNAIRYTKKDSVIDVSLHGPYQRSVQQQTTYHDTKRRQTNSISSDISHNKAPIFYDLCIEDNGPGIPEKDLINIFEPFFRVDDARNQKTGGYGIGLAIAKRVISQHGGEINAHNTESGLAVSISLPGATDKPMDS